MIHIAVLQKQYLEKLLDGSKTIECRLTRQARDPFENIEPGERIYFKRSAGPYGAMAVVDHVLFERDLTPTRVRQLQRDYNEHICGEAAFWKMKRDSRFATLIWVRDVVPIDNGPQIRPLQGVAWLALEEEPAWRKTTSPEQSFHVEVTPGNIRNNSLYVTSVIERFPNEAIGGRGRDEVGQPITLMLHDGPTVETDIVGHNKLIRRRIWGKWFRKHGVSPGDHVVFTPIDDSTFFVGLSRKV